jgi:hypothetical protein
MNADQRKTLLVRLGEYMLSEAEEWKSAKQKATAENPWFTPEFIDVSAHNIAKEFLTPEALSSLIQRYSLQQEIPEPKKVGIVMAGNLPMVGFHDLLCCFLIGHHAYIKLSSKDNVLLDHLVKKLVQWEPASAAYFHIADMLKNCDAYITTGSNNSARYFEYYFSKYPHIIRKNRTSVAILSGEESKEDLDKLADDVHYFFGLGCRNVTKLYVPQGYDFVPLLGAFKKYQHLADHYKFRNNYDYNLAIHIMNNKYYMTNGIILLVENPSPFSPISQVNYEFYSDTTKVLSDLKNDDNIQCVIGKGGMPFGKAQCPSIDNFADGVDTMAFLRSL